MMVMPHGGMFPAMGYSEVGHMLDSIGVSM